MLIDRTKCTGCGRCVPYCPVEAIQWHKRDKKKGVVKPYAEIEREACVPREGLHRDAAARHGEAPADGADRLGDRGTRP